MKPTPFATLTELARNQTDAASRRLGELQRAQLSASEQLTLLHSYRSDYLEQLHAQMAQGLSTERMRNFQHFLGMLDDAIAQQQGLAEQAGQRLDDGRQAWQRSARKLGAFDTLAERFRRHALQAAGRKEQRDTDERAHRLRSHGGPTGMGGLQTDGGA